MAHEHSVFDNDKHFKIDPVTRQIENTSGKVVLIQHDHDSERFTFEIPKTVEDHDMSKCNVVQIHYLNIEAATGMNNADIYEVDDLQVSNKFDPLGDDVVVCSWLISRNATQFVGSLNFVVRFKCVEDDGTVSYEWATAIHKGIAVSDSIYNSDVISSEYADVLEKWRASLFFNTDGVTGDIAIGGYKITGMGTPTDETDGATKGYVDEALRNIDLSGVDASDKVSKAGDIMAGQLDMNTNKIIGLGDPEDDADAANKAYVDEKVDSIDVSEQLGELSEELTEKLAKKPEFELLWENARIDSPFSAQTVTVKPTRTYTLYCIVTTEGSLFVSTKMSAYDYSMLGALYEDDEQTIEVHSRNVRLNNNSFVFAGAYEQGIADQEEPWADTADYYIIPIAIYGVI